MFALKYGKISYSKLLHKKNEEATEGVVKLFSKHYKYVNNITKIQRHYYTQLETCVMYLYYNIVEYVKQCAFRHQHRHQTPIPAAARKEKKNRKLQSRNDARRWWRKCLISN